ncbi:MAG: primosomal protein N' [Bacilli bacterium]|nr:primosomal protein N' [Bacilli bacterium]
MYAEVLVEIKAKAVDKTFTYRVPDGMKLFVGVRVLVPFGKRNLEGFVLNVFDDGNFDYELKNITSVIDEKPVINSEMLKLGKYISKKTLSPLITAYQTMLPSALKAKNGFNINKKYVSYLTVCDDNPVLKTDKQKEVFNYIKDNGKVLKKDAISISSYTVKSLIEKGYIKEIKEEVYRLSDDIEIEKTDFPLTECQKDVLSKVDLFNFKPYLLHGVTGSGKTLVYIKLIEKVIESGKEVILLVPEISLTPQMVNIFKKHFGKVVAILHSGLSDGEKYDEWRKIENREVSIVIGARSAVFAPFTNLGIIIVDEEHSATYKQENLPKYSAIDVAIWRCKNYNIPLILGSATPSVESYTRAKMGTYELLEMSERVNHNLPLVSLVDMKDEFKKGNRVFSSLVIEKLTDCLNQGHQAIVLLNRRGFSTVISCKECGFTHKCPNCDIPLTYHKNTNSMRCHYCDYKTYKFLECPECHSKNINSLGMGTEKLEELLKENFSGAKVVRMDVDTTRNKGSHARIINDFKDGKYNVLLGTQMISKGLDFSNVTLVIVINGDSSLNVPDFRSAERTFQLLNQVAGRAGRGDKKGEVIIQGFNMNHYSIVCASKHDYSSFYSEELKIRKTLKYPPYYNLCHIKISGKDYDKVYDEASKISYYLRKEIPNNIILGPSALNIPKINNTYYLGIIIKFKNTSEIISALNFVNDKYKTNSKVMVEVDLNPLKL